MLMACEICKQEFITESDPYVIRPTPKGYIHYCSCMIVGHNQMSGIDKLQAENKKLREALEYIQSNTESSYIFNWAEEALKKE